MIATGTVKPVYSGHLGTSQKYPDYQGVLIFQVSLHVNGYFGTITKSPDYGGVPIFQGSWSTGFTVYLNYLSRIHKYSNHHISRDFISLTYVTKKICSFSLGITRTCVHYNHLRTNWNFYFYHLQTNNPTIELLYTHQTQLSNPVDTCV